MQVYVQQSMIRTFPLKPLIDSGLRVRPVCYSFKFRGRNRWDKLHVYILESIIQDITVRSRSSNFCIISITLSIFSILG